MLKVSFKAETGIEEINPINVAAALIAMPEEVLTERPFFNDNDLEEIGKHLLLHVERVRKDREAMKNGDHRDW